MSNRARLTERPAVRRFGYAAAEDGDRTAGAKRRSRERRQARAIKRSAA